MTDQENAAAELSTEGGDGEEQSLQDKLKDAISVKVEEVGSLRKKLVISIPRASIDEQLDERYDDLRDKAQVPGFRPGRAPQKLLEKRFGSEVGEEVNHKLVSNAYLAGIEKESLDPLGDPLIRVSVTETRADEGGKDQEVSVEQLLPMGEALEHLACPAEGDWDIECEVEVRPVFEIPELKGIKITKPALKIAKKDVTEEIKRFNMMRGTYKPVEDGKSITDDILVGTFKVTCDGNVIKSEDDAELAVRDQRYDGILLEGFGKASTGMKVGDVVTLDTTLPDDYTDIELREKTAKCELEISLVKRLDVPEIDAAYLETMGFESKKEFEDHVQDTMEQSLRQKVRQEMRNQAREHLLKNADFDIPEGVSQRHTEHLVGQQMMNLYRQGVPDGEISKHADELRTAASEQARNELKLVFMMDKIAEDMKVDVSEEEINGAIATIAARRNRRFDRVRDEIISTGHLRTLYVQLRDEKVLEKLLDDADVSEVEEKDKAPSSKKKAPSDKKKTAAKGKKKKDDSE